MQTVFCERPSSRPGCFWRGSVRNPLLPILHFPSASLIRLVRRSLPPPFLFLSFSRPSELSRILHPELAAREWHTLFGNECRSRAVTDRHLLSLKALSLLCCKDTEHTNTVLHSRPRLGQEEKTTFSQPFFLMFPSSLPCSLKEACKKTLYQAEWAAGKDWLRRRGTKGISV